MVNPASRRGARQEEIALRAFHEAGTVCDVVRTERPGHGAEVAERSGRDYDAVFALGGDGTVMEVVGALAHSSIPVGVLPGGTGNLIARTLGIPPDVGDAVRELLRGEEARIDLGRIGDRRFAFAAGVGIDAAMVEETPSHMKRRLGVWAYAMTATRAAMRRDAFEVRAVVDGVEHRRMATAVLIANFGALFDELFVVGPGIRSDDGTLDLCVYSPESLWDSVRIAWRLLRKDFRTDPRMLYASGRRIELHTDPPRPYQADGDLLGMTPFTVDVEPLAAHVLLPRRDRSSAALPPAPHPAPPAAAPRG